MSGRESPANIRKRKPSPRGAASIGPFSQSPAPVTVGAGTIFFFARRAGWKFPEPEAPKPPEDPGWWHSLEQSLLEDQSVAEVAEVRAEVSQQQPPHNFRDGLVINPPIHWTAPAPLREWLIEEWIPIGYVTGLYGDGGIGKSLIAQQLLTSTSLAMPWLGLNVVGGRAFGFMCEDDASELHRRQEGINRNYGIEMMNLEYLRIAAETRVRQPSDDVRPGKSGSTHRPLH